MVVRELIAKLGLRTDKASFQKADKKVNQTKNLLASIGGLITVGIAVRGINKFINLASDAQEVYNVLTSVFGKNTKAVQDWSIAFSEATGRSIFGLRETASQLGALVNPLLNYDFDLTTKISQDLTALAADFSSFYNKSDEEVLTALKSGLTGISMPLKKFGIIMDQAGLKAFALEEGITKDVKAMDQQELTLLRYNFLMAKGALVQGDATKTANRHANAMRGVKSSLRDMATIIGFKVLPFVEKMVVGLKNFLKTAKDVVKNTKVVEAALLVLGTVGAAAALKMIIAWGPALLPFAKLALVIGGVILVLDDFLTFLEGGDSVIGRFIDSIWGPGSASEATEKLKQTWQDTQDFLSKVVFPFWFETFPKALKDFVSFVKSGVTSAIDSIGSAFDSVVNGIKSGIDSLMEGFSKVADGIKDIFGIDIKGFFKDLNKETKKIDTSGIGLDVNVLGLDETFRKIKGQSEIGVLSQGMRGTPIQGSFGDIANKLKQGIEISRERKQAAIPKRDTNVIFNQKTHVTVNGGVGSKVTRDLVSKVSKATKDVNKAAMRALTQTAGN